MNKEVKFSGKIFALYQSISDDLMFWAVFDVLIMSQLKGFSALDISLVFTISYWASIAMQWPCYYVSRRLRAGGSIILAAVLFLSASLLITFGSSLPIIIAGQCFYYAAVAIQKMSLSILKAATSARNRHNDYVRIMSSANTIYSSLTLIAAASMTWLFSVDPYLPMYICICFCLASLFLSLIVSRYDSSNTEQRISLIPGRKIPIMDKTTIVCLIMSILGMAILSLSGENLRIMMENNLSSMLHIDVVLVYSIIIIATRLAKLSGNVIALFDKQKFLSRENTFAVLVLLLVSVPVLGVLSGAAKGIVMIVLVGAGLLIRAAVYDSYKVYLSSFMLDRLKPEKMTQVLFFDNIATNLFKSIFSSIATIVIAFSNVYCVMFLILFLALLLGGCFVFFRKFIVRHEIRKCYLSWTQSDIGDTDSLLTAATVLMHQYQIVSSMEYTPIHVAESVHSIDEIDRLSRHFHFDAITPYTETSLHELYSQGHPCAIRVKVNSESQAAWLPVIFLDHDGGIVWNFRYDEVFINHFYEVSEICSFRID